MLCTSNKSGRLYENGRYYPWALQEYVLDMNHSGLL